MSYFFDFELVFTFGLIEVKLNKTITKVQLF